MTASHRETDTVPELADLLGNRDSEKNLDRERKRAAAESIDTGRRAQPRPEERSRARHRAGGKMDYQDLALVRMAGKSTRQEPLKLQLVDSLLQKGFVGTGSTAVDREGEQEFSTVEQDTVSLEYKNFVRASSLLLSGVLVLFVALGVGNVIASSTATAVVAFLSIFVIGFWKQLYGLRQS
jgi:hypothetical protein